MLFSCVYHILLLRDLCVYYILSLYFVHTFDVRSTYVLHTVHVAYSLARVWSVSDGVAV